MIHSDASLDAKWVVLKDSYLAATTEIGMAIWWAATRAMLKVDETVVQ